MLAVGPHGGQGLTFTVIHTPICRLLSSQVDRPTPTATLGLTDVCLLVGFVTLAECPRWLPGKGPSCWVLDEGVGRCRPPHLPLVQVK